MRRTLTVALLTLAGMTIAAPGWAECYRIIATNSTPSSPYYTEPGKGTAANWDGSADAAGSIGSLPTTVNQTTAPSSLMERYLPAARWTSYNPVASLTALSRSCFAAPPAGRRPV